MQCSPPAQWLLSCRTVHPKPPSGPPKGSTWRICAGKSTKGLNQRVKFYPKKQQTFIILLRPIDVHSRARAVSSETSSCPSVGIGSAPGRTSWGLGPRCTPPSGWSWQSGGGQSRAMPGQGSPWPWRLQTSRQSWSLGFGSICVKSGTHGLSTSF